MDNTIAISSDNSNIYNNNLVQNVNPIKDKSNDAYINNLIPLNQLPKERQREIALMGSQAAAKKRMVTTAIIKELSRTPYSSAKEILKSIDENATADSNLQVGAIALVNQMQKGNIQAASLIVDRIDGKLSEKLEVKADIGLSRFTEYFSNFQAIEGYGEEDEE